MKPAALLLDIGNTRLKWALLPDTYAPRGARRRFIEAGVLELDPRRRIVPGTGSALARLVARAPARIPILGCNVAGGAIERQIGTAVSRAGRSPPHWARSAPSAAGVRNAYREPWRLGVDRWAALIGAHAAWPARALCLISIGTALTIDLLDAHGRHRGGLIAPGPNLMIAALLERTAGIRRRAGGAGVARDLGAGPPEFWARDTRAALRAGALQSAAALIAQARREASELLGATPRLLVTGGGAAAVAALLPAGARQEPDLALQGLAVLSLQQRAVHAARFA